MAGVAAPAAFYWLIVGYGLQRKELSLSREQLEVQAAELRRQAEAALALVDFQRTAEMRSELQERMEAMEQKLLNIIDVVYRFGNLGPRASNNKHPVQFFGGGIRDRNMGAIRNFCRQFQATALAWDEKHGANYGPLATCMQEKNPTAYADLIAARRRLSDWWLGCQEISKELKSQALEDQGEAYGIDEFLMALDHILTIRATVEVQLDDATLKASATVS
ncbi:MAG: hypothetical protein NXH88_07765 [Hyphomonas sp.]|nr:hypothetical protein [Hyphomonas sp.]